MYLVGTVIARSQALRYLPANTHNKWYSYICFQAACELLFGKTTCYATMTKDFGISSNMKKTKNKDLFLIKVREPLMLGNSIMYTISYGCLLCACVIFLQRTGIK